MQHTFSNESIQAASMNVSTAHIADACLRIGAPVRALPTELRSVGPIRRRVGRALPVRHAGSVDIFLEALETATPGDVFVIDDGGRTSEACIGDLVVLEMQNAGIAAVIVWGCHRDSSEITQMDLPCMSLGSCPSGPVSARERASDALIAAQVGDITVKRTDFIIIDDDGAIAVSDAIMSPVLAIAQRIRDSERAQAAEMHTGATLRYQLQFAGYLSERRQNRSYSFREHLRRIGGAIEE